MEIRAKGPHPDMSQEDKVHTDHCPVLGQSLVLLQVFRQKEVKDCQVWVVEL
jgi:hypothetical protein